MQALLALALFSSASWGLEVIGGELGATIIDDKVYWVVRFQPELILGKLGVGLDIELLMGEEEGIRDADWDEDHKWIRLIRYVRYGYPEGILYARAGALDDLTIGHGFIVNHYKNWYDEDYQRLGLHLRGNSNVLGGACFSSNLAMWEVVGARVWMAPLGSLSMPLIRCLRLGGTAAVDLDPDNDWDTSDEIRIAGVDAELPLLAGPPIGLYLYADHAHILDYGSGQAVGVGSNLGRFAGVSDIQARLERRFLGDAFIPAYFDAFYGLQRYDPSTGLNKKALLDSVESGRAVYGELRGTILGVVTVMGGYQYIDERPHSGVLHFDGTLEGFPGGISFRASLDKTGIEKASDLFDEDESTLMEAEMGYRLNVYTMLYVLYRKTFERQEDGSYRAVEVIKPRLAISMEF